MTPVFGFLIIFARLDVGKRVLFWVDVGILLTGEFWELISVLVHELLNSGMVPDIGIGLIVLSNQELLVFVTKGTYSGIPVIGFKLSETSPVLLVVVWMGWSFFLKSDSSIE